MGGTTFGRALALTVLGALVPGAGLVPRRRVLGWGLVAAFVLGVGFLAYQAVTDLGWYAQIGTDATVLRVLAGVVALLALGWVATVVGTWLLNRPRTLTSGQRVAAAVVVGLLSFAIAAPAAVVSRYALSQASLIDSVFGGRKRSQTASEGWHGKGRVNILLLGADTSDFRRKEQGITDLRTDTMILASVDTASGAMVLVQLPRNMARAPFPPGPLRDAYPDGLYNGHANDQDYALNAVWSQVPAQHPELFADSDQPGADAIKMSVGEITGLVPDYYALVDLNGLVAVIDAMGGVRVNVNQRLPIDGSAEHPERVTGWIEVGPDQRLDGFHALWYGRSRFLDPEGDYGRMARQRCLVKAVVDQADPLTLLTKYDSIANASKNMVRTDIPAEVLGQLADLALVVRESGRVTSVLFAHGKAGFDTTDPDFAMMRERVNQAVAASTASGSPSPTASTAAPTSATPTSSSPSSSASTGASSSTPSASAPGGSSSSPSASSTPAAPVDVADACAYHPSETPSAAPSR